jgi:hypothetical protein
VVISSSTVAGAALVLAGLVSLCAYWVMGDSLGPLLERNADCAMLPPAAATASNQPSDARPACAASINAMHPNFTWGEALARGFRR